jgi:L1 cell adhesion molecule like protein
MGKEVKKAVITVPAYFNDAQRKATQAAGAIAGLEVLRIINEPTAAALGYGLDQQDAGRDGAHVLVFDLGGGTFDVSVLRIEGGIVEVKATGGDTRLGGEDFDMCLTDWLLGELKKKGHVPDEKVRAKAKRAAEGAKRALSANDVVQIEVGELVGGGDGDLQVTRAHFEKLCQPFFSRTLDTVKAVLKDAKLDSKQVDDIVLVGGSTRVPCIQKMLMDFFGGKALCKSINPDEAVAYGAAVQGAIMSGVRLSKSTELLLIDVTPLSLGIETEGKHHSVIIPRNTALPCTKEHTYTTVENYQDAIDVRVFEGERPCTDGNHLLGEFTVTGIERAKRGEAQVVVQFALDTNGVLNVKAFDKKTRATNSCRIADACKGLDQAEIERMLQEADAMKATDAEHAEKLEVRNAIEEAAYSLNDDERDEVLDWLAALSLASITKAKLERKLQEISSR